MPCGHHYVILLIRTTINILYARLTVNFNCNIYFIYQSCVQDTLQI